MFTSQKWHLFCLISNRHMSATNPFAAVKPLTTLYLTKFIPVFLTLLKVLSLLCAFHYFDISASFLPSAESSTHQTPLVSPYSYPTLSLLNLWGRLMIGFYIGLCVFFFVPIRLQHLHVNVWISVLWAVSHKMMVFLSIGFCMIVV